MLSRDVLAADAGELVSRSVVVLGDRDAGGVHDDVMVLAQQDHLVDVGVSTEAPRREVVGVQADRPDAAREDAMPISGHHRPSLVPVGQSLRTTQFEYLAGRLIGNNRLH